MPPEDMAPTYVLFNNTAAAHYPPWLLIGRLLAGYLVVGTFIVLYSAF